MAAAGPGGVGVGQGQGRDGVGAGQGRGEACRAYLDPQASGFLENRRGWWCVGGRKGCAWREMPGL